MIIYSNFLFDLDFNKRKIFEWLSIGLFKANKLFWWLSHFNILKILQI